MNEDPTSRPAHEATDASPRTVGILAAALALLIILGIGGGMETVHHLSAGSARAPMVTPFSRGPLSRPDVDLSWDQSERESAAHLGGYAWVDRRAGTVRIPLERAMDLIAGETREGAK
jgi:hypothetical protein